MLTKIHAMMGRIKNTNPLILNITNQVTAEFIANGLLSLGALPVMSNAFQEAEELVKLSAAVVINPGTLDDHFIKLSRVVCEAANRFNKPIILDPVGAGASLYRTTYCQHLLEQYQIAIVRGNASEIMALAGATVQTKGVENTAEMQVALESAVALARQQKITIVMSGKIDTIIAEKHVEQFARGSALMPKITGSGCLLSAVVAAFHAVHEHSFEASAAATLFYSICGEIAEQQSKAPGSFKVHFVDALASCSTQIPE